MIVEAVSEPAVLMDLQPGVDSSIAKLGCGRNGGITGFSVSLVVLDFMGLMSYQTGIKAFLEKHIKMSKQFLLENVGNIKIKEDP